MPKYCVLPGDAGEYIMGTYPNADVECRNNGGTIDNRGQVDCGSEKSASPRTNSTGSKMSPLTAAVVGPIKALRARLPESAVLRELAAVNYSKGVLRLLDDDPEIRSRAGDVVGMASQFALLALVDPGSPTLAKSCYTQELHLWLVELADMVKERSNDKDLGLAVDRLVKHFEPMVGLSIGALIQSLSGELTVTH